MKPKHKGSRLKWSRRSSLLLAAVVAVIMLLNLMLPLVSRAETLGPTPVVLVRGVLFPGQKPEDTWAQLIARFEAEGYVQGESLFVVDPPGAKMEDAAGELSLLTDAQYVAVETRRILSATGASQVDLIGHSRGGLIVKLLATGETAPMVRRAVTMDAPFNGVLSAEQMEPIFAAAQLPAALRSAFVPADLEIGSRALATISDRENRFADVQAPALVIGSTWVEGAPAYLKDHDGVVALSSQLAWKGARTHVARLGPSAEELNTLSDFMLLITRNPHVAVNDDEATLDVVLQFLKDPAVTAPQRSCEPNCADYASLKGHWSEHEITPFLDKLPYELDQWNQRVFDPNRPMSRAEFVYGLMNMLGKPETFRASAFTDMRGHWALGYVETASDAGLVKGVAPDAFGPNQPLTRAAVATLVARAKGLTAPAGPSRFTDTQGHWAEASIEAAAAAGIVKGSDGKYRPEDPVTMAEGAAILVRSFGK